MALIKKGKYWHYAFKYKGKRYQGSTDQTNINQAKRVETKVRSDVGLEGFGLAAPHLSPPFQEFMEGRFLDHIRKHNAPKPNTVHFYEEKTLRLLEYPPFRKARVGEIDENAASIFTTWRLKQKRRHRLSGLMSPTSVNLELATLRKALNLAYKWQLISRMPDIERLPGKEGRLFILTGEMEKQYLDLAHYPLQHVAVLMLDWGLRPEELLKMEKPDVTDEGVIVWSGKSKNAFRIVPHTERTREILAVCTALFPDSKWVFPGRVKGEHLTRSAIDNMHGALRDAHLDLFPKEFVLYSLRHTFGTRSDESGMSPFQIKTLMGHYDIRVTQKYVHPSTEGLALAMRRKEDFDKILRGEKSVGDVEVTSKRQEVPEKTP